MSTPSPRTTVLTNGQTVTMIAAGVIGWFAAAMVVKLGGPRGLFGGPLAVALYVGTVLVWLPTYALLKRALSLVGMQPIVAVALGTGVAALCDSLAMPLAGSMFYTPDGTTSFLGAAWILWFVSVGLLTAVIDNNRRQDA